MSGRLDRVSNQELQARAHCAGYSAHELARSYGMSLRQLERFAHEVHGTTPHQCLRHMRMRRAVELVGDKASVKEAAQDLGYKSPSHFSNDFKRYYRVAPSQYTSKGSQPP